MSYLISDLKNDITSKLHGTSLSKINNPLGVIYEAARNVLSRVDFQETKRISPITNAIYDDVYSYPLPSDIKGDKYVSILPQTSVNPADNMSKIYAEQFELYKSQRSNISDVEYNNGNKVLKLSIPNARQGETLHSVDTISGNGTWAISNDASNLNKDTLTKYSGSGSLRFDLDTTGSVGTLTNSTFSSVDGSDEEDVGALFMPVFLSTAANITSVELKWGNDASNLWKVTVTSTNEGLSFQDGWNLLRFDWEGATEIGTPDASALDYLQVNINYDGTATPNCRIDNIVLRLGEIYNINYYSKYLFKNNSGVWIEKPTVDTDSVNLDTDSYNILLYEVCFLVTQELQGENGVFDRNYWDAKREEAIQDYVQSNPGEAIKAQGTYRRRLYESRRRGVRQRRP